MNTIRKSCWYDLIGKGLANSGLQVQEFETASGRVTRYMRPEEVAAAAGPVATTEVRPTELPAWLRTEAPPQATAIDAVRPSDPADDDRNRVRTGESIVLRARALQRGTLAHRLLQSLPDVPAGRRHEAALGYLARNATAWTDDERERLARRALELIADNRFAAVFGPGSRAEVAIVGRLDRPGLSPAVVSGQIDRLMVTESEILIVDFKTNHAPPGLAADAPQSYVRQLGLYRAVLQKLYPQRPVRAALLWTETPEMMEISTPALEAALASLHLGVSELDPARSRS